jgi:uncharacterized protein YlbG (UPF0298 family)
MLYVNNLEVGSLKNDMSRNLYIHKISGAGVTALETFFASLDQGILLVIKSCLWYKS